MNSRFSDSAAAIVAGLAAVFLFSANLHTDDTGIIAGVLLLLAALVSLLSRRIGRQLGSLLGLSIVTSELWNFFVLAPRSGMRRPMDFILLTMVVTVIAVAGSLLGYMANRFFWTSARIH
jgi:heme/copper-type cytochrome/quinol oxidase subunit 4